MKKILFADDDAAILDVVSLIFEDEYEIVTCMNGDLLLKTNPLIPDLFLIDKQLGGTNGLDICSVPEGTVRNEERSGDFDIGQPGYICRS